MIEDTMIEEGLVDVDGAEKVLDNELKDEIIAANDLHSGNADVDDELIDQVEGEDPEDAALADDDDDVDYVEAEEEIIDDDEDEPESDQTDLVIDDEEEDY